MRHFWAFSMLGVERIHVMIKKLGKSKRNIMASIQKNNDLLCQSQLEWRFQKDHKWSNEGKGSSLHIKQAVPVAQAIVQPRGAMWKKKVRASMLQTLENEWTVRGKPFDKLRDRWITYSKNQRRARKKPLKFSDWQKSQNLQEEQKKD